MPVDTVGTDVDDERGGSRRIVTGAGLGAGDEIEQGIEAPCGNGVGDRTGSVLLRSVADGFVRDTGLLVHRDGDGRTARVGSRRFS